MTKIPHVRFTGILVSDSEFANPPGASFARALESQLHEHAGSVQPFENWRDSGWMVMLQLSGKTLEVYFAPVNPEKNEWLLAIAPHAQPGFLGRLLGRKSVECAAELKVISMVVHGLLVNTSGVSNLNWFLGGPPESVPTAASPEQLSWA